MQAGKLMHVILCPTVWNKRKNMSKQFFWVFSTQTVSGQKHCFYVMFYELGEKLA
jgi:hypothetical protein